MTKPVFYLPATGGVHPLSPHTEVRLTLETWNQFSWELVVQNCHIMDGSKQSLKPAQEKEWILVGSWPWPTWQPYLYSEEVAGSVQSHGSLGWTAVLTKKAQLVLSSLNPPCKISELMVKATQKQCLHQHLTDRRNAAGYNSNLIQIGSLMASLLLCLVWEESCLFETVCTSYARETEQSKTNSSNLVTTVINVIVYICSVGVQHLVKQLVLQLG